MTLPFTATEFFQVFRAYNLSVWPAQIVLTASALATVALVFRPRPWTGRVIALILGVLWLWLGLAYHLLFFSGINTAAYAFALLSVAGGLVFLWQGVWHRRLRFKPAKNLRVYTGAALVVYSLVLYPLWIRLAGHAWPAVPGFGLPCPTTIFTIGLLGFLELPCPRSVFIAPLIWSLIGSQAALLLNVPPDFSLLAAGLVCLVYLFQDPPDRRHMRGDYSG